MLVPLGIQGIQPLPLLKSLPLPPMIKLCLQPHPNVGTGDWMDHWWSSLALLLSIICALWTLLNCTNHVVQVSQPRFLCQLCLGTFVMSLTIVPLSMQEQLSDDGTITVVANVDLDAACMAVPWLFWTGFAVAVSALLAKTMRLNKLMHRDQSKGMRRIVVRHRDVLQPLIIMMICNVSLLLSCTLVAPYKWHRVPVESNVDMFNRGLESYGSAHKKGI